MTELADIVSELEHWKMGRGVLLYGAGHTFCSGGDLTLMKSIFEAPKGLHMSIFMQNTLIRFFRLPLVTMAHVEGRALGGGAELTVACDLRSASKDASIGFVQARLGIAPGWGGVVRLTQLVGRTRALHLITSASVLSSKKAHEYGLVEYITSNGQDGIDEARSHLQSLTNASPGAIQAAKKMVLNATDMDFVKAMQVESSLFQSVWGSPAHIEAMTANMKFTTET